LSEVNGKQKMGMGMRWGQVNENNEGVGGNGGTD